MARAVSVSASASNSKMMHSGELKASAALRAMVATTSTATTGEAMECPASTSLASRRACSLLGREQLGVLHGQADHAADRLRGGDLLLREVALPRVQ